MTHRALIDVISNICDALLVEVRKTDIEHMADLDVTSSGCLEDMKKKQAHSANMINRRHVLGAPRSVLPIAVDAGKYPG